MNDPLIAYMQESGVVAIVVPSGEVPFEEVRKRDVPEGVASFVIDRSEVPFDRTFRNAWILMDGRIGIDFDLAKGCAMERWRRWLRQERLTILTDEDDQRIRAKYLGLRNEIDAAENLDTLQALMTKMGVPE